jgi:hypothetical protein
MQAGAHRLVKDSRANGTLHCNQDDGSKKMKIRKKAG